MKTILILALMLGQKFYPGDPVRRDNDGAIQVNQVANQTISPYFDFIRHTFGKPGDRTKR